MNINEEGKYYASKVRKFRTEYKSKYLHGFCKEQIDRLTVSIQPLFWRFER